MAKLGKDANVISHWHHPVENFNTSTMDFYSSVEAALKPRQIPEYSTSRIDWRESGMLSARREYLRIKRGKLVFDLCAAPFGTGFFFSWWLAELPPSHPLLWAALFFAVVCAVFGLCIGVLGWTGVLAGIVACVLLVWLLGYSHWTALESSEKRQIVEHITEKIVVGKEDIAINLCYLPSSAELVTERQRNFTVAMIEPLGVVALSHAESRRCNGFSGESTVVKLRPLHRSHL